MKDQYFGDVNDYRRNALLRFLQSNNESRLGEPVLLGINSSYQLGCELEPLSSCLQN